MDQSTLYTSTRIRLSRRLPILSPFRSVSLRTKYEENLTTSATNYSVQIPTGTKIRSIAQHCQVLDTGTCRNFIIKSQIHANIRSRIEPADTSAIIDANRNQLKVMVSIYLWVRLGQVKAMRNSLFVGTLQYLIWLAACILIKTSSQYLRWRSSFKGKTGYVPGS